jgi:hypothetical protein
MEPTLKLSAAGRDGEVQIQRQVSAGSVRKSGSARGATLSDAPQSLLTTMMRNGPPTRFRIASRNG